MKKTIQTILTLSLVIFIASCGSKKSSNENESPKVTKEPKTEEEFRAVLNNFDISLYDGSEIINVKTGEMKTIVSPSKGDPKKIMDYYTKQVEKTFKGRGEWVEHMKSSASVSYRKGYTGWNFGVSVNNKKTDKGYEVTIAYHKI